MLFFYILTISLQLYYTYVAGELSALPNPCFTTPDSSDCTAFICASRGISTVACQNYVEGVRAEIKKFADSDQLRTSSDAAISPYAMGVACFAKGHSVPGEHDCASCLHCTQQLSDNVCHLFCPEPSPAPSPSTAIPPIPQLHTAAGAGARDASETPSTPTTSHSEQKGSNVILFGCLGFVVIVIGLIALITLIAIFIRLRLRRKSNSGTYTFLRHRAQLIISMLENS